MGSKVSNFERKGEMNIQNIIYLCLGIFIIITIIFIRLISNQTKFPQKWSLETYNGKKDSVFFWGKGKEVYNPKVFVNSASPQ